MQSEFQYLPVGDLQSGLYQPRKNFDSMALEELAASIASQGLIEPLIVRQIIAGRYEIIAGERRWRAAKMAGLTSVPCMIGQYSDKDACALSLIENIQREDLGLIEEAEAYKRLMDEFHYQQDEIAVLMGKSRSHIANLVRLLTLTTMVKQLISDKWLTLGHARLLVGLEPLIQESFATLCKEEQWSVRQLEHAVKLHKEKQGELPKKAALDKNIARLQTVLAEQLGYPVEITQEVGQGGWLKMRFFDNDTLAGLLERLSLRYD